MNALIDAACTMAKRGAAEYLSRNNLTAEPEALQTCLRFWVKTMLPSALTDAKEAIACNMPQAAEATFTASMICAGVEAAKEASKPKEVAV